MNLESSQGITSQSETRINPLLRPDVIAKRRRAFRRWQKKNPGAQAANLAKARAARAKKIAKKRGAVPQARKIATTQSSSVSTLSISSETKRLFDAFRNNAASVDFALRALLNTVKGKKLVAKPVAVEYTVE